MGNDDEARQSLLLESRDHSLVNEKSDLQRRRTRHGTVSDPEINLHQHNTTVQTPSGPARSPSQSVTAKSPPLPEFDFKPVYFWLAAYLGGGTLCFFLTGYQIQGIKTNGFLDALYFCVVTMTTVGYGDLVPQSSTTKLLACFYVFTGMALGGLILSKAADFVVEKQEMLLVSAMNKDRMSAGSVELPKEFRSRRTKNKFIVAVGTFLTLMILGTLFLYFVEKLDFVDAFYCVCSTVTTLGYGDKSFSSTIGRTFAVFWILSSTICLAQSFAYLAELRTEDRQRALANLILTRKLSVLDLEAADLDGDDTVSAAEFVVYKLKEMGKISIEDISEVMEIFRKLDIDESGTLTEADLISHIPTTLDPYLAPKQSG